ncbi:PD-(D/E)XK motif protein [Arthrobacter sp. AB6]|uniref:PD-(D/E)XK motif protein n=1 Tax=Arthrobacter sp. AB6 TaxID=2962570 RepID=UPI0028820E71|nr:PD-(D/E)XK motif protein [Arthrobacter sp. AB6]MDT0195707.1 PD-(D/E)XK motif protein [Arthrobacter sp. AB6]
MNSRLEPYHSDDVDLDAAWKSLESSRSSIGEVRRRLSSPPGQDRFALISFTSGRRRGLLFKAPGELKEIQPGLPSVAGLDIRLIDVGGGNLELRILESASEVTSVFRALARDITNCVEGTKAGALIKQVVRRLELWQGFFTVARQGLAAQAQAGLVAELLTLRDYFIPYAGEEKAADSWFGPERALQDFCDSQLAVEVKSTSSTGSRQVTIANERQLDLVQTETFLMAAYSLDIRGDGIGFKLPSLVADVREAMNGNEHAKLTLEARLIRSGYIDDHSGQYTNTFEVRKRQWFEIREDFPRITESIIPHGISHVSYKIDLESCGPWVLSAGDVLDVFRRTYA